MPDMAAVAGPASTGLRQNQNWRLFWLSQSASLTGDIVFDTSVLLWVVQIVARHQPWAPAAGSGVLIAAMLPALLLGPFAGVFVDRWDRRRTMLLADAIRALLIAALIPLAFPSVAAHVPRFAQLAVIYLVVAAAACFSQFFNPSRFAMLGAIVSEPDVPKASSLLMSSTYAASIIGPPLAAPLLFAAGVQWALLINALSFAMSFLGIRHMRLPATPEDPGTPGVHPAEGPRGYWRELAAGLRFFGASPVLVALTVGLFVTVLGANALNALNVFFVQVNLHSSASLFGTIGMAEGIGGLLGTLAAGWVITRAGASRVFCIGLVLSGIAIVCYSRTSSLIVALAVIVVIGLVAGCVNTAIAPLILATTPQHMIGRIMSVIGPAATVAGIASLAAAGTLTSTVLRGLHASLAGVTFGPYDTVIAVGGLLFMVAGLAAIAPLHRAAPDSANSPQAPRARPHIS